MMPDEASILAVVFGGTGFLGRRIVEQLLAAGFRVRVVSRHAEPQSDGADANPQACRADIHDDEAVSLAVEGADAVTNAVSLYVEGEGATFQSVHVDGARRLARICREQGVRRLVQISGIGANPDSTSRYIRARGEGEFAVRSAFPLAVVVRPAVMFGPDDSFLTTLISIVRTFPVIPLFGRGETKLQPVFVEDIAHAMASILSLSEDTEPTHELGGPKVYTYRGLVETVAQSLGVRRLLIPFPFVAWKALGAVGDRVPRIHLTLNQVELMEVDNIAGGDTDLARLGVQPTSLESMLPSLLEASRRPQ